MSVYGYDNAGNVGINFGLNNLQKVGDGDPLGGRSTPEADFKAVTTNTNVENAGDLFTDASSDGGEGAPANSVDSLLS